MGNMNQEIKFFARHLVAFGTSYQHLNVSGEPEGEPKISVYSGFVMSFQNVWFYITAGHAFEQFMNALESPQIKIGETFLADYFGLDPKISTTIPFDCTSDRPILYLDESSQALDFGFTPILPHERRWLEANGIIALDEIQWKRQEGLVFDAHLLLGIPEYLTESVPHQTQVAVAINPTILQLIEETQPEDVHSDGSWFVGRIPPKIQIENIVGMSGGPIFGLKIHPDKRLQYWVVALQSWWRPDERMTFGCKLTEFAPIIEEWLQKTVRELDAPETSEELDEG